MRELFLPGLKALVASVLVTLGIGALLGASAALANRMPRTLCDGDIGWFCEAARFWNVYWFSVFVLLSLPLQAFFFVVLVRRFAVKGRRLRVAGLMMAIVFGGSLVGHSLAAYGTAGRGDWLALLIVALDASLFALGMFWLTRGAAIQGA